MTTLELEKCNNSIKKYIKNEHINKSYNEDDVSNIILKINENVSKECNNNDPILITEIIQYLYYSSKDSTFYFNPNKKQIKLREYHNKIINKLNI